MIRYFVKVYGEDIIILISASLTLVGLFYALTAMHPPISPNEFGPATDSIVYIFDKGSSLFFGERYFATGHIGF